MQREFAGLLNFTFRPFLSFPNFGHSGVPHCYDDSVPLKKMEMDLVKAIGPWPALHINMNKVWYRTGMHAKGVLAYFILIK